MQDALNKAFVLAGGPAALALGIGAPQSAPHMWLARGNVPVKWRAAIEQFLTGAISVESFGDDVTWRRVKDRSWPWNGGRPLLDVTREVA